ncbi:MAG: YkgJ family cysteine cluster protein [Candidatus Aureabacteria bacterium]|nr:YkgJ family cysteine cluster protein [Candidatus Auribacterota bacterium]
MAEGLDKKIEQLEGLYKTIPKTQCTKTTCADWCCSRLPTAVNADGLFISLPLIYSIEFLNIKKFITENFQKKDIEEFYDYNSKRPLCSFKDPKSPGCLIYPVRPFTCRVFGRCVPPVFFGMEYPPEAANEIFCPHLKIMDKDKEKVFQDRFPVYWTELANLSASVSVFTIEQLDAIHRVSDVHDIFITGWKEFALLTSATPLWLEKNFASFWKAHGNLL